jgi:hypothetical protein
MPQSHASKPMRTLLRPKADKPYPARRDKSHNAPKKLDKSKLLPVGHTDLSAAPTADMVGHYANYWQTLTSETVGQFGGYAARDIRFFDPFNDVVGVDKVVAILRHAFQTVEAPKFVVTDWALGQKAAFLRWDFTFILRQSNTENCLSGVSELWFNHQGLATIHIDHWDSGTQFYEKLPVFDFLIRQVKKRLQVR